MESRHSVLDSRSVSSGSVSSPATDEYPSEDTHSQRSSKGTSADEVQDHVTQRTVVHIASNFHAKGCIVPQKLYCPPVNQTRRMGRNGLNTPIMFFLANPDYCGISCDDALHLRVRRLVDRDEWAFQNDTGNKTISLRLMVCISLHVIWHTTNRWDIVAWLSILLSPDPDTRLQGPAAAYHYL